MGKGLGSGETFTAKAFVFTFTVPQVYNVDAHTAFSIFEVAGEEQTLDISYTVPDPGPWVRLIDDPVYVSLKQVQGELDRRVLKLMWKGKRKIKRKLRKANRQLQMVNGQLNALQTF